MDCVRHVLEFLNFFSVSHLCALDPFRVRQVVEVKVSQHAALWDGIL